MKHLIIILAACIFTASVYAEDGELPDNMPGVEQDVTDGSTEEGGSDIDGSLNSNNGNSNSNNLTVNGDSFSGSTTNVKQANTPSAIAPQLTSGLDTCTVANTGAISGPGFGISLGRSKTDKICESLKLAKMLQSIGLTDAAVALLAQDKRVAKAIRLTYPELAEKVIGPEKRKKGKR